MCIYYKDKENLTYNKQEHIFPHCIGGMKKLEKNVVSDQANEYFSKLELHTFRKTAVLAGRIINGPMKKPSKRKHIEEPQYVYNTENDSRVFGKIAINVLAELRGAEYIQSGIFDDFINWIMGESNEKFHCKMGNEIMNIFDQKALASKSHYCAFVQDNDDLIACVSLYGYWKKMLAITSKFDKSFLTPTGMVCNFRDQKEYSLIKFLSENIKT